MSYPSTRDQVIIIIEWQGSSPYTHPWHASYLPTTAANNVAEGPKSTGEVKAPEEPSNKNAKNVEQFLIYCVISPLLSSRLSVRRCFKWWVRIVLVTVLYSTIDSPYHRVRCNKTSPLRSLSSEDSDSTLIMEIHYCILAIYIGCSTFKLIGRSWRSSAALATFAQ